MRAARMRQCLDDMAFNQPASGGYMNSNAVTAAISGGAGMLGSIFGGIFQTKNVKRQIKAQLEENQRNREYNLNLARMQNQWNIDQWNRENAYNDPSMVMARLKAAGLNPDLVYQNGAAQTPSAVSPAMTSGAPSSPVDMSGLLQMPNYGNVFRSAMEAAAQGAGIRKTGRESDKIQVQANQISIDNVTRAAQNQVALEAGRANIFLSKSTAELNDEKKNEVKINCNKISAEIDKIYSDRDVNLKKIELMDAKIVETRFNMWMKSRQFDEMVKLWQSEVNRNNAAAAVDRTTAEFQVMTMAARAYGISLDNSGKLAGIHKTRWDVSNAAKQGQLLDIGIDRATVELENYKEHGGDLMASQVALRRCAAAGQIINSVGNFIGNAAGAINPIKSAVGGLARNASPAQLPNYNPPQWNTSGAYMGGY